MMVIVFLSALGIIAALGFSHAIKVKTVCILLAAVLVFAIGGILVYIRPVSIETVLGGEFDAVLATLDDDTSVAISYSVAGKPQGFRAETTRYELAATAGDEAFSALLDALHASTYRASLINWSRAAAFSGATDHFWIQIPINGKLTEIWMYETAAGMLGVRLSDSRSYDVDEGLFDAVCAVIAEYGTIAETS